MKIEPVGRGTYAARKSKAMPFLAASTILSRYTSTDSDEEKEFIHDRFHHIYDKMLKSTGTPNINCSPNWSDEMWDDFYFSCAVSLLEEEGRHPE